MSIETAKRGPDCEHDWCGKVAVCERCAELLLARCDLAAAAIRRLCADGQRKDAELARLKTIRGRVVGGAILEVLVTDTRAVDLADAAETAATKMATEQPWNDTAAELQQTIAQLRGMIHVAVR